MPKPVQTSLPQFSPIVQQLNRQKMTVSIQMDKQAISNIVNRTREYKALPRQMRPMMEDLAHYVDTRMIPHVFAKEGPGWQRLARRTVREREAQGYGGRHPILQRSRDLYQELTDKSHPKHIEVIRVGKRARIEVGGSSKKFRENQLGKRSQRLPARPMIPGTGGLSILDSDRKEMTRIIENAYQRYLSRPK